MKYIKPISNTILILLLLINAYFLLRVVNTIQSNIENQNILGELYNQYLWNSILQLFYLTSVFLSDIVLLMFLNFRLFNGRQKYKIHGIILTATYSIIYALLFVYLKYNSVDLWNPLFIILLSFSTLPIAQIIIYTFADFKKK